MARYPQGGGLTAVGRDKREQVRMQAAQWFGEGRANVWIAAELRVGLRQVEKWRQAWRQGGAEALRSKGPHGRPRLDEAQFAQLEAELNRGPAAHGYADDQRWTLGRIAALITDLFGIGYSLPGVSLLLRRNGWSVQVPGRRAIQRDEQAISVWKEQVWPQVETSRRTWAPGSVSRTRPVKGSGRPTDAPGAATDTARW
ncbi:winged helix-turn-helix domain-containing protein [Actinomadura viridis]|uniref:Transposase n=1 Tax=Actinomadura viridis TaxID=58110 RepID=A0A931GQ48_9ACTN|nr:winged helix-turn-helix domain-containing protein [Actinomadura viridis]MBG6088099.1 transposase [Actinomadura viridis]